MKKITIKFPNNMEVEEAVMYIPSAFNNDVTHFKAMEVGGEKNNLTYSNNRLGVLSLEKSGYVLEIKDIIKEESSDVKQ